MLSVPGAIFWLLGKEKPYLCNYSVASNCWNVVIKACFPRVWFSWFSISEQSGIYFRYSITADSLSLKSERHKCCIFHCCVFSFTSERDYKKKWLCIMTLFKVWSSWDTLSLSVFYQNKAPWQLSGSLLAFPLCQLPNCAVASFKMANGVENSQHCSL